MPIQRLSMLCRAVPFAIFIAIPIHAGGQPLVCPDDRFVVDYPAGKAEAVCDSASRAAEKLGKCSLGIARDIRIEVAETLDEHCAGLYHCGEDRIELHSPDTILDGFPEDSRMRALDASTAFDSILMHELAHAASEDMPCPFDACTLGREYIGYAMQLHGMDAGARTALLGNLGETETISRDEISLTMMYMAPEVFMLKAYLHFSQRPDPCGYIGQIRSGDILLDVERP